MSWHLRFCNLMCGFFAAGGPATASRSMCSTEDAHAAGGDPAYGGADASYKGGADGSSLVGVAAGASSSGAAVPRSEESFAVAAGLPVTTGLPITGLPYTGVPETIAPVGPSGFCCFLI